MRDAIVVIDVQNDFRSIMTADFIESIKNLAQYSHILNIPVLWVKAHYFQVSPPKFSEEDRLKGTHTGSPLCIEGTFGAEIVDEFLPFLTQPHAQVIIKKWYSAFKETSLRAQLLMYGVDRLVLCGLTASTCVSATYRDALDLGFQTVVIEDCVAAFTPKKLSHSLSSFQHVISLSEYTKGFKVFCEGDTYLLNDIFPQSVYTEETFDELAAAEGWKAATIRGGTLSRLVNIQAKRDATLADGFVPLYRNPGDEYMEAEPLSEKVEQMMEYLNQRLNLDGHTLNHVFMKYYRVAADGIGRHSDKTLDLLPHSYIANVSLGSTRTMTFRHKITGEKQCAELKSNSCLLIGMRTNGVWLHEVKGIKEGGALSPAQQLHQGARMSFTFRSVGTYYCRERNEFRGLGAPTAENSSPVDDRVLMIAAFSAENALADFDRQSYYGRGFWALHT